MRRSPADNIDAPRFNSVDANLRKSFRSEPHPDPYPAKVESYPPHQSYSQALPDLEPERENNDFLRTSYGRAPTPPPGLQRMQPLSLDLQQHLSEPNSEHPTPTADYSARMPTSAKPVDSTAFNYNNNDFAPSMSRNNDLLQRSTRGRENTIEDILSSVKFDQPSGSSSPPGLIQRPPTPPFDGPSSPRNQGASKDLYPPRPASIRMRSPLGGDDRVPTPPPDIPDDIPSPDVEDRDTGT